MNTSFRFNIKTLPNLIMAYEGKRHLSEAAIVVNNSSEQRTTH